MINAVIVGFGKMGKIRYNAMRNHGGYNILAVCDITPSMMDGYDCSKYTDWKLCIDEIKPDAVVVCVANKAIPDVVCYSLERGIQVFSEKPPGRNLNDANIMRDAANKSGKLLKFGFNHRYHNSIIEAKVLLDNKLLGEPVCARGVYGKAGSLAFATEWRNNTDVSGGGILLDQGIHMLDLLTWFFGAFSLVGGTVNKLVWHDLPTEDSAFAILKTPDGKIASLHSSALQWKHKFDLDIICTEGYISLNGLLTATQSYGEEYITYYHKDLAATSGKIGNPIEHTMCFDNDESWSHEMREFYDCVTNGTPVINGTPDEAVHLMELITQIYSAKGGELNA